MSTQNTQTQTPSEGGSFSQTPSLEEELEKKILVEEDRLISQKILEVLESEEKEKEEEEKSEEEIEKEIDDTVWYISQMFALLHGGHKPRIVLYYDDLLGFSKDELTMEIGFVSSYEVDVSIFVPSGARIGYMEMRLDGNNTDRKENYEETLRIYRKWKNILKIAEEFAKVRKNE
jgi:hypothetical protein